MEPCVSKQGVQPFGLIVIWHSRDCSMIVVWQSHDCSMTVIWHSRDWMMTVIWHSPGCSMAAIWHSRDWMMTVVWHSPGCSMTVIWHSYDCYIIEFGLSAQPLAAAIGCALAAKMKGRRYRWSTNKHQMIDTVSLLIVNIINSTCDDRWPMSNVDPGRWFFSSEA